MANHTSNNGRRRPVIAYYPDGTSQRFESIKDAAADSDLCLDTVRCIIEGKTKHDPLEYWGVRFELEKEKG